MTEISREDYMQTQIQLTLLAGIVHDLPLHDFLQAINHTDTIGPILNPTLWIRGERTMHEFEKLADALLPFQKAAAEFIKKAEEQKRNERG